MGQPATVESSTGVFDSGAHISSQPHLQRSPGSSSCLVPLSGTCWAWCVAGQKQHVLSERAEEATLGDVEGSADAVLDLARRTQLDSVGPVYQQIASRLRTAAAAGTLVPGMRLPPERRLAEAFGVSRMTLRQALDAVQLSGELARAVGGRGGVVVAAKLSQVNIADLIGLRPQLLRSAKTAEARVVSAETVPAETHVAQALELDEGDTVHRIIRVRFADNVAVVLERSSFPARDLPGLLDHDLTGSLYRILRQHYRQAPAYATQDLASMLVDGMDAELLEVEPGLPVLQVVRISSTPRGRPIEHSRDLFRSDQLRVTVAGRIATDEPTTPTSDDAPPLTGDPIIG